MKLEKNVKRSQSPLLIFIGNKIRFRQRSLGHLFIGIAAAASSSLSAPAAAQANVSLNKYFTLESTISQFGPGSPISQSYYSGLVGTSWGSYRGNSPLTYGVNGIIGNQNAVIIPAVPGTPSIYVPGSPTFTVPGVCVPLIGCSPSITTPGTPGFTIPAIPGTPAVTADTRSGFGINVASSGRVGVEFRSEVTAGTIKASIPLDTRLDIKGDVGSGIFTMKANSLMAPGASITATAPTVQFGVSGVIELKNSIGGTGCIIGAGCSSSTSDVNITPGKFTVVGLDTAQNNGITLSGINIPISTNTGSYTIRKDQVPCKTSECANIPISVSGPALVTASYALPQTITSNSLSGNKLDTLSLTRKDTVIQTNANLTGIVQTALGFPIDALSPNLAVKVPKIPFAIGSVTGTTVNAQAGFELGLSQFFKIDGIDSDNLAVTLNFEKPVSLVANYDNLITCAQPLLSGCAPTVPPEFLQLGKTVTLDMDDEMAFFGGGSLISYSYGFKNLKTLTSETSIDIGLNMPIKAACYKVSVPGFGTDDCAYEYTRSFDLTSIPIVENMFSFDFGKKTFLIPIAIDNEVSPGLDPVMGTVAEPSSILLVGLAMLGMGASLNRRRKKIPQL